MRALFAEILDNQPVSPGTLGELPGMNSFWSKMEVAIDLDPGSRGRSFPVIELRAGEFAPSAAHAFRRICYYKAFRLLHDYEGCLFSGFCLKNGKSYGDDSTNEKKLPP